MTEATEKLVLDYFRAFAAGRANARPLRLIVPELNDLGLKTTRGKFQQTILPNFRSEERFIGQCGDGLFLVVTAEDAEVSERWYRQRMASEQANLDKLLVLKSSLQLCHTVSQSKPITVISERLESCQAA